jgi:putative ABC transport system ATP-binding protein
VIWPISSSATTHSFGRTAALRGVGIDVAAGAVLAIMTCRENVALPLRPAGTSRDQAGATALAWSARPEVDDVAGKRSGDVSGGQGQRVVVARAPVTSPKVIFADEPTGALDSLNGEKVMRLLTEAARQRTAAVLVTHEARVAACADREVVVRDGEATVRELVS